MAKQTINNPSKNPRADYSARLQTGWAGSPSPDPRASNNRGECRLCERSDAYDVQPLKNGRKVILACRSCRMLVEDADG